MFKVVYMSVNEYGGLVQYSINLRARTEEGAIRKCLEFDSAAWDIYATFID